MLFYLHEDFTTQNGAGPISNLDPVGTFADLRKFIEGERRLSCAAQGFSLAQPLELKGRCAFRVNRERYLARKVRL